MIVIVFKLLKFLTVTNTLQGCHSIDYETASLLDVDLYNSLLFHFCTTFSSNGTLSFVRWLDLFGSINIQFLYANL